MKENQILKRSSTNPSLVCVQFEVSADETHGLDLKKKNQILVALILIQKSFTGFWKRKLASLSLPK